MFIFTPYYNQQKLRGRFTLKYPPNDVDILIFQNKSSIGNSFLFGLEPCFGKFENATLSPIRGSSVPGKPMEYWNMTARPVHL